MSVILSQVNILWEGKSGGKRHGNTWRKVKLSVCQINKMTTGMLRLIQPASWSNLSSHWPAIRSMARELRSSYKTNQWFCPSFMPGINISAISVLGSLCIRSQSLHSCYYEDLLSLLLHIASHSDCSHIFGKKNHSNAENIWSWNIRQQSAACHNSMCCSVFSFNNKYCYSWGSDEHWYSHAAFLVSSQIALNYISHHPQPANMLAVIQVS